MSHKIPFELYFDESLKENSNLTTKKISLSDAINFSQEEDQLNKKLEESKKSSLKVDYTNFSNHTFFNSAISKFGIAKNKIFSYPFNGSRKEKDEFELSSSGYERHIFDIWPKSVGFSHLNGTSQFITASDNDNKLLIGSGSLYISTWILPKITDQNIIVQYVSASTAPVRKAGFDFYLSGATDPYIKFVLYSGSTEISVSSSYSAHTTSFSNIAAIYDNEADLLSLYINRNRVHSATANLNTIELTPTTINVGSGSQFSASYSNYNFYTGSIDEVRVLHTASEIYHQKNYNRYIDSEDYVGLYYKFNEGIVGTSSIDDIVVDYSKNGIHGRIVGYTSTARISGTSLTKDDGDPILYSFHSGVIAFTSSIENSASLYDIENKNLITRLIPEDILLEDEKVAGLLNTFSLFMARSFDEWKLYVDQFDNTKVTSYEDMNESPDILLPMITKYFGFKSTRHFDNANPLEFFFGEDVLITGSIDSSLFDIRNQFWRRILNNLPYLYKTKGKRHSIDSYLNVIGINKNLFSVKEFGHLNNGTIDDSRIYKQVDEYAVGIGTGSLSASFFKAPLLITGTFNHYTIETFVQLPTMSSSLSAAYLELTGALWQFVDPEQLTGSYTLLWNRNATNSNSGKFILTGSDGQSFSSSVIDVFDGNFVNIASGIKVDRKPFIEIRYIDIDTISFSASYNGTTALSGVFTGSKYDFIVGANSGSTYAYKAHGFFGETRVWNRSLSGSELDDHSLNFRSVGVQDSLNIWKHLRAHWSLNENLTSNNVGRINGITDLSRNKNFLTGTQFLANHNSYKKFLFDYNYLSPVANLKWNDNKIRIRNKDELTLNDVANDTNEVALEFNLVDALNEDITKIFSTFSDLNTIIGHPINKYRDEYSELESYRKIYFERLSTQLNFNNFFKLFKWFDKKLSDSIKQLLPARVRFVGGEQVIESHMLERNKIGYKYPIFKTPKDIGTGSFDAMSGTFGNLQQYVKSQNSTKGTYVSSKFESLPRKASSTFTRGYVTIESGYETVESGYLSSFGVTHFDALNIKQRDVSNVVEMNVQQGSNIVLKNTYGVEEVDRNKNENNNARFYRLKTFGDLADEVNNASIGINFRNEFSRRELTRKDKDNE